jgi:hypothetical protein
MFLEVHLCDTGKHFWEMSLDHLNLSGVTNDFKKILITDEIESSEGLSLLIQVFTQFFLNVIKGV